MAGDYGAEQPMMPGLLFQQAKCNIMQVLLQESPN
jgi:hypothetical protein